MFVASGVHLALHWRQPVALLSLGAERRSQRCRGRLRDMKHDHRQTVVMVLKHRRSPWVRGRGLGAASGGGPFLRVVRLVAAVPLLAGLRAVAGLGLKSVEVIHRALRVAGGRDNQALVVLQHLQP